MSIILALVIFSAIILFHELGHFVLAKANGIVVTEFSLGMGPRLFSFDKGGTKYSLKLLPFGGSCAMLGEDEASNVEGAFNTKSVWARISVVAAGPIFNFILAFVSGVVILSVVGYDPALVMSVEKGSPAEAAGLMEEDLITRFNGEKIDISRDLMLKMMLEEIPEDQEIQLTYERDGQEHEITFMPQTYTKYMLGFTGVNEDGRILITGLVPGLPMANSKVHEGDYLVGFDGYEFKDFVDWNNYMEQHPLDGSEVVVTFERDGLLYEDTMVPKETSGAVAGFSYNTGRTPTNFWGVLKYGVIEIRYWIELTLKSLGMLVTGQVGMNEVSGPVGVVDAIGDTYNQVKSEGFVMVVMNMLNMVIMLSANLGVMNLIPIPALDGGRLIFMLIEAVRGKPIDREKEGMVHFVGFMLLMAFMIFVFYQDIVKLF